MSGLSAGEAQAVMDAVRREVIAGVAWDEVKEVTLWELCNRNQDALIDDLYEDDPRDRAHIPGMIAHVKTYDQMLGTDRASEIPAGSEVMTRAQQGNPKPGEVFDTWTVYASSGEYSETAGSLLVAAAQFMTSHPDDFVHAVVCDGMQPPLVLAETE